MIEIDIYPQFIIIVTINSSKVREVSHIIYFMEWVKAMTIIWMNEILHTLTVLLLLSTNFGQSG
jgi:hypothetical protein